MAVWLIIVIVILIIVVVGVVVIGIQQFPFSVCLSVSFSRVCSISSLAPPRLFPSLPLSPVLPSLPSFLLSLSPSSSSGICPFQTKRRGTRRREGSNNSNSRRCKQPQTPEGKCVRVCMCEMNTNSSKLETRTQKKKKCEEV